MDQIISTDALLNATTLLPLRALVVSLQFTAEAHFSFFHQPALYAFIRNLPDSTDEFDTLLTLDAPESGRTHYAKGDHYRFVIYAFNGADEALANLIKQLQNLPDSAPIQDQAVPLRNNLQLTSLHDLFTEAPIQTAADLTDYDAARLESESQIWSYAPAITLRWLSPARLLKRKDDRPKKGGEQRYCRDGRDLSDGLLLSRVYDTFADLLRRRAETVSPRDDPPPTDFNGENLFWVDSEYCNATGKSKPVGGLCGDITLGAGQKIPLPWLHLLVLGQYIGLGQRRAFGLGRYQLLAVDGASTAPLAKPTHSLLACAAKPENLFSAYCVINDNQKKKHSQKAAGQEDEDEAWYQARYSDLPDPEEGERLADRLEALGRKLTQPDGPLAPLRGVVIQEPDGDLRALAIPPFWDRVTQRAITQQITPGLEQIFYHRSHGYRRGRSRQSASLDIQQAWRAGYRWVYEADIDDFFDNVDWYKLECRLHALYRDDPIVEQLLSWTRAPIEYQGQRIERRNGLPQGSPVSPILANLMLDDFDSDLENAGFRLVRYADDFVVLCKDQQEAEEAAKLVRQSLQEIGLKLNEAKSRMISFEQGFHFLGYLFLNDMILETSGKSQQDLKTPSPPPNSWLAKLGEKGATALKNYSGKKTKTPTKPKARHIQLGERTNQGAVIILTGRTALVSTRNNRLIVTRDDKVETESPWQGVSSLLLIGNHHITTPAIRAALEAEITIHLAKGTGQYQGVMHRGLPTSEGGALWLRQLEQFQYTEEILPAARQLVMARLRHMRETLRQRQPTGFRTARDQIQKNQQEAGKATNLQTLNGLEGSGTRAYFQALAELVPKEYDFNGRNRRPPRDPFNALLSLGYTILYTHTETLLHVDGLYPWAGFYHQPHGRHSALASDLMEPFRHLVERVALTAVIRGQLKPTDFYLDSVTGCRLSPAALKIYITLLWEKFNTPIQSVGEEEAYPLLQNLHRQNRRLIEWIRGGAEFTPWVTR